MAEEYTGDEGNDALDAGYDIMDGTEDRREGWRAINKTRDLIAQLASQTLAAIWPINRGGTGANTAAGARTNLEVPSLTAVAGWLSEKVNNLGSGSNSIGLQWIGGRIKMRVDATDVGDIATVGDVLGRVDKAGDTMGGSLTVNGHIYIPAASAGGSGTIAYVQNSDSRITRGVSAERYKRHINLIDPLELGDIFPALVEYEMREEFGGDGTRFVGHIADWMIGTAAARFVTHRDEEVDAIDVIQLLLAQNAVLNARLRILEGRSDA